MASMDFREFRDALLAGSEARAAEKIEVNQRHLIDKILARYSAEYTIFREVLQNANDACALALEILFEEADQTSASKSSLKQDQQQPRMATNICLRNNGRPFDDADWNRLQKIAEGNPDEQKIGFFGVGFYSLFSICEEPFVVSGDNCLAFYWKGDQLYARPAKVPSEHRNEWTCIFLKLREPLPIPNLDDFAHFLTKSLLFTQFTEIINVACNKEILFRVLKKRSPSTDLAISPSQVLQNSSTKPHGLFTLRTVTTQAVQIDLDKRFTSSRKHNSSSGIFSGLWSIAKNLAKDKQTKIDEEQAKQPGIFSIFLHIVSAQVKVTTNSSFASEMERITKKKPPKTLQISLLYASYDEVEASSDAIRKTIKHPVLFGILPMAEDHGHGKVFIGFETHQTTGLAVHLAGPFIPTVERESLDFVDKNLSIWNQELFKVGGKMIRLIYEVEIQNLSKLFPQIDQHDVSSAYWDRSKHITNCFGISPSTPTSIVAAIIMDEFANASKISSFMVPSSMGITSIKNIRSIPTSVQSFVKGIPCLLEEKESNYFNDLLARFFSIPQASFSEVMSSLGKTELSDKEIIACLEWIIQQNSKNKVGFRDYYSMISNLSVPVGQGATEKRLPFNKATHFASGLLRYESNLPLPSFCLAAKVTEAISGYELVQKFNLKELGIIEWIGCDEVKQYAGLSVENAERVLKFLAQQYPSLSNSEKGRIASQLAMIKIIPTEKGLVIPSESCLEDVKLLGDLATIQFRDRYSFQDEFLIAIGIKSYIDVVEIFKNLDKIHWNHRQLIKYLVKHRARLSQDEFKLLRDARIFPAINDGGKDKHQLKELYLEDPMTRYLKLPLLEWKNGECASNSSESTRFMIELGLNTVAPWELLFQSVVQSNPTDRAKIFGYFVNHYQNEYIGTFDPNQIDYNFLPLEGVDEKGGKRLGHSKSCFTDEKVALLGFDVLAADLRAYAAIFGVKTHPSTDLIAQRLVALQFQISDIDRLFTYLSTIVHEFSSTTLRVLSHAAFIPIGNSYYCPIDIFFNANKFNMGDVFKTIDFGPTARPFLRACGVQDEPKPVHIINRLSIDAEGILAAQGVESYLELLRWIAVQFSEIPRDAIKILQTRKVLLGLGFAQSSSSSLDAEEEIKEKDNQLLTGQYILATANELYIIDDTVAQQLFNCLSVPLDSILEEFYRKLGSMMLSNCIKSTWKYHGKAQATQSSLSLQQLIHDRALLLISVPSASKPRPKAIKSLSGLTVMSVDSIVIKREFQGKVRDQAMTACFQSEQILLVTPVFEFFDVATILARLAYADGRLSDSLLIATLLSSSLASLRAKGFPVDRLMMTKAPLSSSSSHPSIANESKSQESIGTKSGLITNNPTTTSPPPSSHLPIKSNSIETTNPDTIKSSQSSKLQKGFDNTDPIDESKTSNRPTAPLGASAAKVGGGIMSAIKNALTLKSSLKKSPSISTPKPDEPLPDKFDRAELKKTLDMAIVKMKNTNESMISNPAEIKTPSFVDQEAGSFCQVIPSHSLRLWKTLDGIKIFITDSIKLNDDDDVTSLFDKGLLMEFVTLISFIGGEIFEISTLATSIFIDPVSTAIAFNRDQSLFFNYSHFQRQFNSSLDRTQLIINWYLTFCHELAHNFIGPHDQRHEFYMTSYIEQYFTSLFSSLKDTISFVEPTDLND